MNTNAIKLVAGIAWVGVAIVSASPANAKALTSQTGDYASCSASYSNYWTFACYGAHQANYEQNIKFITPGCSAGECNSDTGVVYTDQVYSTGRKTAAFITSCEHNIYEIGACAC